MFTILACADLQGGKVNLELTFPGVPTVGELTRRVEEVFSGEIRSLGGNTDFTVNRIQVYDDVLLKWDDLISSTQLHEYDQVYAFQPQTPWHVDTQQDLPPPRPPTIPGGYAPQHHLQPHQQQGYSVPRSHANQSYQGGPPQQYGHARGPNGDRPNIPPNEKASVVFSDLDTQHRGYLEYADFERALHERGLDFSSNTVGELFYKADLNRDGRITPDEWSNWAQIYPNTMETLYFKTKDTSEEAMLKNQIQQSQESLMQNRARIDNLQRELAQVQNSSASLQSQVGNLQQQSIAAKNRRKEIPGEERELIEEEIKMERQRDQMRVQQARLKEVSERYNRTSAQKGSPRRAREAAM
eukprot:TRINITY_DN5829_c0_g2_i1.p1 TRINITY_DN5829_c0_g2~~TRINITY_DN5829_c0_g2_i1.p1  ORF type:complete len:355 (+),score=72.94 TRINITY_DN5829_c0_g2_i1:109-1173(+)